LRDVLARGGADAVPRLPPIEHQQQQPAAMPRDGVTIGNHRRSPSHRQRRVTAGLPGVNRCREHDAIPQSTHRVRQRHQQSRGGQHRSCAVFGMVRIRFG